MDKVTLEYLKKNLNWHEAVIVFTEDSFEKPYTELQRSYIINSDAKWFKPNTISDSLYGSCLDGTDQGVLLSGYMKLLPHEGKRWNVE